MRAVTRRLQGAGDALRATLAPPPDDDSVRWIEVRGRERSVAVTSVPLDLAPILRDDLFRRVEDAIVTSATLASRWRRGSTSSRRGSVSRIPTLEPTTALFPSPFDFESQCAARDPDRRAGAQRRRGRHTVAP